MNTDQKIQHTRQAERGSKTDLGKVLEELSNPTAPCEQPTFTVSTLPDASLNTGSTAYCSNGAAGSPVLVFSDGTNWLRCDTLAAAS